MNKLFFSKENVAEKPKPNATVKKITFTDLEGIKFIPPLQPNYTLKPEENKPQVKSGEKILPKPGKLPVPSLLPIEDKSILTYNVTTEPTFKESAELQGIVDEILKYAKSQKMPTESLSITLINVKNNTIGSYQKDVLRFPASVVKMFWMVMLYGQIEKGMWKEEDWTPHLKEMLGKSDNNATHFFVEFLTQTNSSLEKLPDQEFEIWKKRRETINTFFREGGYKDINITQKTFPITYLDIREPLGTDLQIRGDDPEKNPIRNKISSYQSARLMYEIVTHQAVSKKSSEKMIKLLTRNTHSEYWKKQPPNPIDFNPVESFFGESIAGKDQFLSKAGWTSKVRNETAFIKSSDGKTEYILSVFADNKDYAGSKKIFPGISRIVDTKMRKLKPESE